MTAGRLAGAYFYSVDECVDCECALFYDNYIETKCLRLQSCKVFKIKRTLNNLRRLIKKADWQWKVDIILMLCSAKNIWHLIKRHTPWLFLRNAKRSARIRVERACVCKNSHPLISIRDFSLFSSLHRRSDGVYWDPFRVKCTERKLNVEFHFIFI